MAARKQGRNLTWNDGLLSQAQPVLVHFHSRFNPIDFKATSLKAIIKVYLQLQTENSCLFYQYAFIFICFPLICIPVVSLT